MDNIVQLTAGITCCSNGIDPSRKAEVVSLVERLNSLGIGAVLSDCVFTKDDVFSGTGRERANALMEFYKDEKIDLILDISGGDIANEVLPYLDYEVIANSEKTFWGYSDLTTIDNAIYAKTGRSSILYQARMLTRDHGEERSGEFLRTVKGQMEHEAGRSLLDFDYEFIRGDILEGIVVGGNIRCFLKLAGTEYWPDMRGKILLLEAWHGRQAQMVTFLSQLQQMGVFEEISGILLGTFTQMEEEGCGPDIIALVKEFAGDKLPIVKSDQIGHGADARAIRIGAKIVRKRSGQ